MKITKKQLQSLVKEAVRQTFKEGLEDIDRAQEAYVDMAIEALSKKTSHLHKKFPDLANKDLIFTLGYIVGSHMFNHAKKLPGQFNPKESVRESSPADWYAKKEKERKAAWKKLEQARKTGDPVAIRKAEEEHNRIANVGD